MERSIPPIVLLVDIRALFDQEPYCFQIARFAGISQSPWIVMPVSHVYGRAAFNKEFHQFHVTVLGCKDQRDPVAD